MPKFQRAFALCAHVQISIWLCLQQCRPINTLKFPGSNPGLPCLTSIYPRAIITLPQAVWECHTEDDKTEIWMCVFGGFYRNANVTAPVAVHA